MPLLLMRLIDMIEEGDTVHYTFYKFTKTGTVRRVVRTMVLVQGDGWIKKHRITGVKFKEEPLVEK